MMKMTFFLKKKSFSRTFVICSGGGFGVAESVFEGPGAPKSILGGREGGRGGRPTTQGAPFLSTFKSGTVQSRGLQSGAATVWGATVSGFGLGNR